jgi:hypothetical protein
MCGAEMRMTVREVSDRIPGTHEAHTRTAREWSCPECDFFEDAIDEEAEGEGGRARR